MNPEEAAYLEQIESQIAAAKAQTSATGMQNYTQGAMLEEQEKGMVQDQLDLSSEIQRIENLLRGKIIKIDKEGNEYWDEPTDDTMRPLNDYGVRLIMKIVNFYLTKNKLLSNYDEDTINVKMEDFSIELTDLIFMKYREMGFDTADKRKMYSMVVREIQDAVHDVYLRALGGKERDSLRKHWNISENVGGMQMQQNKPVNPMNWLRR